MNSLNVSVELPSMSAPPMAVADGPPKITVRDLNFYYGQSKALKNINLTLGTHRVTAFIGPSGCGKSTLLRVFNRMYDLYPGQRAEGQVLLDKSNILDPKLDLNLLRARVGMVFQKPTPFPMTIYENIAFGIRLYEKISKSEMDERRRKGLARRRALGRSEGQAQRLRPQPVRRPAAAPVHRAHRRGPAGGHPVRRALLGARPDLDRQDRGADQRAQGGLHDRHRHPQHAAGRARVGRDGVHVSRRTGRVRPDQQDFHHRRQTGARKTTSPAGSAEPRLRRKQGHGFRTHRKGVRRRPAGAVAAGRRDGRPGRTADRRFRRRARPPRRRGRPHGRGARCRDRQVAARDRGARGADDRAAPADGGRPARDRRRAARGDRSRAHRRPRQEHRQARRPARRRLQSAEADPRPAAHGRRWCSPRSSRCSTPMPRTTCRRR